MALETIKELLLSAGILALVGKIVWDWFKGGSIGGNKYESKQTLITGDTDKIPLGANGKIKPDELANLMSLHRCAAHDHLASGVTEMIVLQKEAVHVQQENGRRLNEVNDHIKTLRSEFNKNFDEAFLRIRATEHRIGNTEGDVKALNAKTEGKL